MTTVFIRIPLDDAVLLVELAEEIGDLSEEEAAAVADARRRIDAWRVDE